MQFIQAGGYRYGRARAIRLIVLHATQSPCEGYADNIANYFSNISNASSHYVCDDATTIQCVRDEDTAFCAPNANADGLHIEQCGYSEWSRTEWLSGAPARMLSEQVVPLVRSLAAKHGIPLRWLTPDQVAAGLSGLCQHVDVTNAYPGTGSHWDCGGGYPADVVLEQIGGSDGFAPASPPVPHARRQPVSIPATLRPGTRWTYDLELIAEGERVPNQAGNGPQVIASTLVVRQAEVAGIDANTTIVWGSGTTSAARTIGGKGEVARFPCAWTGLVSVVSDRELVVRGEQYTA